MKKFVSFGCVAFLVACSSDSTNTTMNSDAGSPSQADAAGGGGTDASSATKPQVLFTGTLKNGSNDDCRDEGALFSVGEGMPVKAGESAGQGTADISCSVVATADGAFNVSATVVLSGATGGLFTVEGRFKASGDQNDIRVRATSKLEANSYKDEKCVVKYSDPTQGVAAGRVSGTVVCPSAVNLADSGRSCEVDAQFRFENCTQ